MNKPTMGRIVRYMSRDGKHERPARIVAAAVDTCNLLVDLDGPNDPVAADQSGGSAISGFTLYVGAAMGGGEPAPGRWHWPPRE